MPRCESAVGSSSDFYSPPVTIDPSQALEEMKILSQYFQLLYSDPALRSECLDWFENQLLSIDEYDDDEGARSVQLLYLIFSSSKSFTSLETLL